MYNRYIPPPKPAKTPSQPAAAASPASWSSSKPYARYIPGQTPTEPQPPAPAQPQRIVFNDDDFPAAKPSKNSPVINGEHAATSEGGKEAKSKKRRRDETDEVIQGDPAESSHEHQQAAEEQVPAAEAKPPTEDQERRPKREKKKKKKQPGSPGVGAVDDDDDAIHKRHRSVFEKVQRSLQIQASVANVDADDKEDGAAEEEAPEAGIEHGLEPLPQPEPVVTGESKATYETLPRWLALPIRVAADKTQPFTALGIAPESAKILESKGFKHAVAVQTEVLPQILSPPDRYGDVVVAAPTGSGKTLSYVLPIVNDISRDAVTRLRALIVLPTRDLVQQVQQAFETCTRAFTANGGRRVEIGIAVGNRMFKNEQSAIMDFEQKYDPQGYQRHAKKRDLIVDLDDWEAEDNPLDDLDVERERPQPLPYHVIAWKSKVDVLICTPGRLVEHINKTPGFTLDYVRWLVIDEADKLLAQDYQQWLGTVLDKLAVEKPGAREFMTTKNSGVRKIILSATMTRDLSLLNRLKLSWPRLVVVEGTKAGEQTLPALLREFAIKIREPSLKPLYLVDLLRNKHMAPVNQDYGVECSAGSETGESEMESESDSESDSGSSSSDSDSDSDAPSFSSSSRVDADEPSPTKRKPSRTTTAEAPKFATTALIFTKSNEAALRLSRLLALLAPDLAPLIGTLTSSTNTSRRARALRAFAQGRLRILVASDLVSRGIDLPNLDHVVNYDLPITETSYVHRVGRTARAGRPGCAWTLLEHAEARRFWRDFVGEGQGASTSIVRAGVVERFRLHEREEEFAEERVRQYEAALESLAREAAGGGEGKGRK
ncbi:uncharacterized protein THITE_2124694 [Thermothielavioides terrestris NRRL 8126]|uniref:ATP-dependent RNA helicase n=1 Tax=Thermothielavioides terrestris (strain ATCC 38088 / NRRL 8126) TaxID=578455 RepID=G2RGA4_THETT|nr:uncharacterized protein THITE_2124694 [Thermothielavioides terrestris NRRL 8126]AEO71847.1 hypothetical protein THITE_2124694 [Thermothielavioides terrestris NRRL 8126]